LSNKLTHNIITLQQNTRLVTIGWKGGSLKYSYRLTEHTEWPSESYWWSWQKVSLNIFNYRTCIYVLAWSHSYHSLCWFYGPWFIYTILKSNRDFHLAIHTTNTCTRFSWTTFTSCTNVASFTPKLSPGYRCKRWVLQWLEPLSCCIEVIWRKLSGCYLKYQIL